jgi:DNA repair exonuclease SbcCD nuclease subunit
MRLLHLTDTHLGLEARFRGAPRGWRRADDMFAAFEAALAPAMRGEVDAVLHTGDVFDRSRPPPADVARACAALAAVARRVPVLVMPGNHDRHGLTRHFDRPPPGVQVVDAPQVVTLAGVRVGVVPYQGDAARFEAAGRALDAPDVIAAHDAFDGAAVPGFVFRERRADVVGARHLPAGALVMCGHIHPRQVTEVGDCVVVYPGSTERTAFSEASQRKGYAIWEFGRTVGWRFVDLDVRPMVVVASPDDLRAVVGASLVRVERGCSNELDHAALARGAWVSPRRPPPAPDQLTMFGAG